MNEFSRSGIVMICCSILEAEVELILNESQDEFKIIFLNSMLHMYPEKLAKLLESNVDRELGEGKKVLLVYGDCCPQMEAIETKSGVVRTRCNNCCDLLLGHDEYKRLSNEGVFFLMPEWTRRWKEVFSKHLGIDSKNIREFMQEMHSRMVYLHTGFVPVQKSALYECADYCGLPYEIRPVSLENFRAAIDTALLKITEGRAEK